MPLRLVPCLIGVAVLVASSAMAAPGAAERIHADVEYLASDLMEGRAAGTRGHDLAAAFVATRLRAAGLAPAAGLGGFVQSVPLRRATLTPGSTESRIGEGGRWRSLGPDALRIAPSIIAARLDLDAALMFAGYGIDEPALGMRDYAGLDPRGKVVIVLAGAPPGLGGEIAAFVKAQKATYAASLGAIGLIEVPAWPRSGGATDLGAAAAAADANGWATLNAAGPEPALARLTISSRLAERLFEGAPRRLEDVQRDALGGRRPTGFALAPRLSVKARSVWRDTPSPQLLARLPGSDPALAAQSIVLVAHLDHLGRTIAAPGADDIANGALDNAAGVVILLEAARQLAAAPRAPRRSVVLLVTTGEELGAIGADFAVSHWPKAAGRPVAALDLDMPLLLYRLADIAAPGAEHSTIAAALAEAGKPLGIVLAPDPMPHQELLVRSDQLRFIERGIPAALLVTGHADGGKAAWANFLAQHYHRPSDDLRQPIRWAEAARLATLVADAVRRLADQPATPGWVQGDFFARRTPPRSITAGDDGR